MNIDQFMFSDYKNQWLKQSGWRYLYVRKGRRCFSGVFYGKVIDLANIEARKPGSGAFTKLIQHLQEAYPDWSIYVENVMPKRFQKHLRKAGWIEVDYEGSGQVFSYFLPAKSAEKLRLGLDSSADPSIM
jgi:hypothetical protein